MRKLTRLLAMLLMAFIASGCATFNASSSYAPEASPNKGLVVFSFTASEEIQNFGLQYESAGTGSSQRGDVTFHTIQDPLDWTTPEKGRLVVMELPAGRYEFYRFIAPLRWMSERFSVPFFATPGKVVYFGNLHVDVGGFRGSIRIDNMASRDLPLLMSRYPRIKPGDITTTLFKVIH